MQYNCEKCKKEYSSYQSLWIHNKKFHTTKKTLKQPIVTLNVIDSTSETIQNIICQYCKKKFTRRNNLNQHIKKICKEKERIQKEELIYKEEFHKLSNEFIKLSKEVEKIKKKSSNKIINYNGPINNGVINNNTLNICKPGQENHALLTKDERKYIMSQGLNSIISLVDHLNFNEKLPQHHNFYVSAINDKHVNTIEIKEPNSKSIIKKSKKDLFDEILIAHITKLENINKTIHYKDFDSILNKLKAFILLKQGKKEFFNQINMLAYNKKNMIIKTWEKLIDDSSINPDEVSNKFENEVKQISEQPDNDDSENDYSDSDDERPQLVIKKKVNNNDIEV